MVIIFLLLTVYIVLIYTIVHVPKGEQVDK